VIRDEISINHIVVWSPASRARIETGINIVRCSYRLYHTTREQQTQQNEKETTAVPPDICCGVRGAERLISNCVISLGMLSRVCFGNFMRKKMCELIVLQISIQLHLLTKIRDFLHARCKKSLLDVKNLPVD
jgi:hypothetical protein